MSLLEQLQAKRNKLAKVATDEKIAITTRKFNQQSTAWEELHNNHNVAVSKQLPETLKILSMNIWCETHNLKERMKALAELIGRYDPHLVALQENTDEAHELLSTESVIRQYCITSFTGQEKGFKTCVLSKYPIHQAYVYNCHGRPCVAAVCPVINTAFGSVHLTSGNNQLKRKQQTKFMTDQLNDIQVNSRIIAGDYNACTAEDNLLIEENSQGRYVDVWQKLHPNDRGFTQRNTRLDRIAFQSDDYICKSVQIIGQDPIIIDKKNLGPISDHYGLFATFTRK